MPGPSITIRAKVELLKLNAAGPISLVNDNLRLGIGPAVSFACHEVIPARQGHSGFAGLKSRAPQLPRPEFQSRAPQLRGELNRPVCSDGKKETRQARRIRALTRLPGRNHSIERNIRSVSSATGKSVSKERPPHPHAGTRNLGGVVAFRNG